MKNLKIIKNNELKDWAEEIFKKNSFNMVDVSSKKETYRRALASGKIYVGKEVFNLIKNKEMPKGDPVTLAEISAVLGVKKTSELIPYVIHCQLIIQLLKSLCMMKIIHLKFFVLYLRLQKQVWRWKL
jgi:molybdenum cofactor biosynthesis enzyme